MGTFTHGNAYEHTIQDAIIWKDALNIFERTSGASPKFLTPSLLRKSLPSFSGTGYAMGVCLSVNLCGMMATINGLRYTVCIF